MAKKTKKSSKKKTSAKKTTRTKSVARGGAAEFVDHLQDNVQLRSKIRKGWNDAIQAAKKKGFKFNREELREHLRQRYSISAPPGADEPDTCFCI